MLCINSQVTSLVEVWIEIYLSPTFLAYLWKSLPLWKCGLKYNIVSGVWWWVQSLPLWKCGLKYITAPKRPRSLAVTSLVEVWIEIAICWLSMISIPSLPLWKCGLKYILGAVKIRRTKSLPLWKCGLKFDSEIFNCSHARSLPLWKCGLKSTHNLSDMSYTQSLPLWKCGLKSKSL